MKKLILSFTLILGLSAAVQAQNWKFSLQGTTPNIIGTTINKGVYSSDVDYTYFDVINISSGSLDAIISRKVIIQPGIGWSEQVCFGNDGGGFCVDLDSSEVLWQATDLVSIAAGDSALAWAKIKPIPNQAAAQYRYYIGVQGDLYQDSVDIAFYSTVGVDEVEKEIALSVSPNPASDYVSIAVSNLEKGNLKIVDVLGNEIRNISFDGSTKLNVAEFRNGVYFIMISGEGVKTINRKLVVKH